MARSTVIAIGCWLWATMTSLFALTHSLAAAMPICAMNGVGARSGAAAPSSNLAAAHAAALPLRGCAVKPPPPCS